MRIVDLIEKKKRGEEHSKEEINFIIDSLQAEIVQDYQLSAWLMAVYFKGMTENETVYLTDALIQSGEIVNLHELASKVVDMHTTGGVGDKTPIVLIPLLVAAGIPTIKLLGRGISNKGGTIDKFESIPGFNTSLAVPDVINRIRNTHSAISSQIQYIAPANRTLQALKYATGTIDSMPLIASSVVSKKVATGADNIIIDVKFGSGAFMKTIEDAEQLANLIVRVGKRLNKSIVAVITSMDEPIGRAVGNSLEIIEAIEFLKGKIQDSDFANLVYEFGAIALMQLKRYENKDDAIQYLKYLVSSGAALNKFKEIIIRHKGNPNVIEHYDKFPLPMYKIKCISQKSGFINKIDSGKIAFACQLLGAVRNKKSDEIDKSVGIYLNKKNGEWVEVGETLFTIYSNTRDITEIEQCGLSAFTITESQNQQRSLVHNIIRDI